MFHGKLRIHTCRVILLTSLVWFLIDVVLLSFYSDCHGVSCKKGEEYAVELPEALSQEKEDFKLKENEVAREGSDADR